MKSKKTITLKKWALIEKTRRRSRWLPVVFDTKQEAIDNHCEGELLFSVEVKLLREIQVKPWR